MSKVLQSEIIDAVSIATHAQNAHARVNKIDKATTKLEAAIQSINNAWGTGENQALKKNAKILTEAIASLKEQIKKTSKFIDLCKEIDITKTQLAALHEQYNSFILQPNNDKTNVQLNIQVLTEAQAKVLLPLEQQLNALLVDDPRRSQLVPQIQALTQQQEQELQPWKRALSEVEGRLQALQTQHEYQTRPLQAKLQGLQQQLDTLSIPKTDPKILELEQIIRTLQAQHQAERRALQDDNAKKTSAKEIAEDKLSRLIQLHMIIHSMQKELYDISQKLELKNAIAGQTPEQQKELQALLAKREGIKADIENTQHELDALVLQQAANPAAELKPQAQSRSYFVTGIACAAASSLMLFAAKMKGAHFVTQKSAPVLVGGTIVLSGAMTAINWVFDKGIEATTGDASSKLRP